MYIQNIYFFKEIVQLDFYILQGPNHSQPFLFDPQNLVKFDKLDVYWIGTHLCVLMISEITIIKDRKLWLGGRKLKFTQCCALLDHVTISYGGSDKYLWRLFGLLTFWSRAPTFFKFCQLRLTAEGTWMSHSFGERLCPGYFEELCPGCFEECLQAWYKKKTSQAIAIIVFWENQSVITLLPKST